MFKKQAASFVKGLFIGSIILGVSLIFINTYNYVTFAQDDGTNPPSFPLCITQTEDGDKAHYNEGTHSVPGNPDWLIGSDDVYTLSSGNYLQCYCPTEGTDGIQTNWWDIGSLNLSSEEITGFESENWVFVGNGSDWDLLAHPYLAKSFGYSCNTTVTPTPTETPEITPTETPEITPTETPVVTPTVTPTPTQTLTPTPTITPTPGPEPESRCTGLSASPTEGTAPLTVKFTGSGFDEKGDIKSYKFDFGDASGDQPQVWEQDESEAAHRYENPGDYIASLSVKDSRGNWRNGQDSCKVNITVSERPQVMGITTTNELPKTGGGLWFGFGLLSFGASGLYLYKRFQLI